jgi:hypothetical protein
LSNCCWLLLVYISSPDLLDPTFSESRLHGQLWNSPGPLLRLRLRPRFPISFKGTLPPSSSKSSWSQEFSNTEMSSALHVRICMLGLIYWAWGQTT